MYNRTLVECVIDVSDDSHVCSGYDVRRKYFRDPPSLQTDQITYFLLRDKKIIRLKHFQLALHDIVVKLSYQFMFIMPQTANLTPQENMRILAENTTRLRNQNAK